MARWLTEVLSPIQSETYRVTGADGWRSAGKRGRSGLGLDLSFGMAMGRARTYGLVESTNDAIQFAGERDG